MQIHYIGKKTTCKGKRLFDILCRLKNFGVGRIVLRNHYLQQYPEPTYYVIQKVDPDMSDPTQADLDRIVPSMAIVRQIFRSQDFGEVPLTATFKDDWQLVPRADEHKYLNIVKKPLPRNVVPDAIPFPPLLNHFIMMERQRKGESLDERPMLPITSVLLPKPFIYPAETDENSA